MTNRGSSFKRWLATGIAISVLSLAGGCAVSPERRAQFAPAAVNVKAGEGLVALQVSGNRVRVTDKFLKWQQLVVRNVASNETHTLFDRADTSAAHSLFLGSLPAGTYELIEVNGRSFASETRGWASVAQAFPSFTVADGRVTDLGTAVYILAHGGGGTRGYRWGHAESPLERSAILRQLEPTLAARLGAQPVLGWNDPNLLQMRRLDLAALRSSTMRAHSPTRLSDGSTLFGEAFGQIAVRTPAAQWQVLQTPVTLPIRTLHVDGKTLYAGSDDGILLAGSLAGTEWNPIALPVADASVIHIGPLPGTEELLVVLQTRDRFVGLSTDRAAPGTWREHFSYPRYLSMGGDFDANGAVRLAGERLLFASFGEDSATELLAYDRVGRKWSAVKTEGGAPFDKWAMLPGGQIGSFRGIPMTGMYFTMSQDGGTSWQRRGDLNWATGPLLFVSDTVGYVMRMDKLETMGRKEVEMSLWRTDDAGRTWKSLGRTPASAIDGKLLALGNESQIGYVSGEGKFFASDDGGQTWKLERSAP
ncbi:MAG: hypothetical protein AB1807_20875 [Pseudomonadota bacterium]